MHSKVIIASLVCVLAASFNAGKGITSNFARPTKQTEVTIDHAPNDDQTYFSISGEDSYAGDQVCADFNHEEPLSTLYLYQYSPGVTANVSLSSDGVWSTVYVNIPQQAGDYFATFAYRYIGETTTRKKTIYVRSDGTYQYASSLSADDARGQFFYHHVASSEERDFLSYREEYSFDYSPNRSAPNRANTGTKTKGLVNHLDQIDGTGYISSSFKDKIIIDRPWQPVTPVTPTYELTRFDAEKHYADYVYGNRNDAVVDTPTFSLSSSTTNNVNVTVNVSWFDENNVERPLKGIKVDLLAPDNTSMDGVSGDAHFTNNSGVYSTTIPYNIAKNYQREELQLRISSVSRATYVENGNCLNYPICYSVKDQTNLHLFTKRLSRYSSVTFNVRVYTGLSDRANAYEICQAQALPYQYVNAFTDGVSTVRTEYPYGYSAYFNFRNYSHIVRIEQEDYKCWDLLNHEYAHYICDMLNLCHTPENGMDYLHNIHENLIEKYGYYDGPEIAYREGLATYIAIASQLYGAQNSNISGVGDEIYQDPRRNLTVNYNNYSPAGFPAWGQTLHGEAIESNVTSLLLKLLDNTNRMGDFVSLGHSAMWNVIANSYSYSICELITAIVDSYPSLTGRIRTLAMFEFVAEEIIIPKPVLKWTIMLYLCGGGGLEGCAIEDVNEILRAGSIPWDVNVIIQAGGTTNWPSRFSNTSMGRYHVEGSHLAFDEALPITDDMSEQSTFESFLDWGLTEYPAEKVGVILWNHGGGIGGVCYDDANYGDGLDSIETSQAFANVFQTHGITSKLEFIGYDACQMQVQDVAEFNEPYFKYMVGSEDNEPGDGWEYDEWLPELYAKRSTDVILNKICDSYYDYCSGTLSVLDLSYMDAYFTAFENFALTIKNYVPMSTLTQIINSCRKSSYVNGGSGTIDVGNFIVLVYVNNSTHGYMPSDTIIATMQAYSNLIKYNPHTNGATGMTVHVAFGDSPWYPSGLTHFNNWRSIFIA